TLARHLGLPPVPGQAWPHFRSDVLEVASVGLRAVDIDARVAECRTPTLMIAAGACGALSPELRQGALVVPETVTVPGSPPRVMLARPRAVSDAFVLCRGTAAALRNVAAALAQVARAA